MGHLTEEWAATVVKDKLIIALHVSHANSSNVLDYTYTHNEICEVKGCNEGMRNLYQQNIESVFTGIP